MEGLGEAFREAYAVMVYTKDAEKRREADRWITEFQKSAEAWAVVDDVLRQPDSAVKLELQFMAAKIFHTKMRYDFCEQIPAVERVPLRERLMAHLVRHFEQGRAKHAVVTQLCLAVAALVIQMDEWEGAIKDLATRLGGSQQSTYCLIQLLEVIPEEHDSKSLNVSKTRRAQLSMEMFDCCEDVLGFLTRCREAGASAGTLDGFIEQKILKCLRAWILIVEIPGEVLSRNPLLGHVFETVARRAELFDTATSVLTAIISTYDLPEEPGHVAMMNVVVPRVFQLADLFTLAVQEDDEEVAAGLCDVFVSMAHRFVPLMLGHEFAEMPRVLELVLLGTRHSSVEIASKTWNFWWVLMDRLLRDFRSREMQARKVVELTPFIQRVVEQCLSKLMLPGDHGNPEAVSSRELEDEFYFNRRDIEDLLRQCCRVLGPQAVAEVVCRELETASAALLGAQNPAEQVQLWRPVEALIYAAHAFCTPDMFSSSSSAGHVAGGFIVGTGLQLPNVSVLLRESVTRLFGTYAVFLRWNPQKLEPCVLYCLETMQLTPQIASVGAKSIRSLADYCHNDMVFAGQHLLAMAHCDNDQIRLNDRLVLIDGLATIIKWQPHVQAVSAIQHVAQPSKATLERTAAILAARQNQDPAAASAAMPSVDEVVFAVRAVEELLHNSTRPRSKWRDPPEGQGGGSTDANSSSAGEGGRSGAGDVDSGATGEGAASEGDGHHHHRHHHHHHHSNDDLDGHQPRHQHNGQHGSKRAETPHPGLELFQQLWKPLTVVTLGLSSNARIVEKLASLFKVCIRSLNTSFMPFLMEFLQLMVQGLRQSKQSPFVYAAGIAMEKFGREDPRLHDSFVPIMSEICGEVVQVLNSMEAFTNNPDLVEDFFITAERVVLGMPRKMMHQPFFPVIFQYGASGALIEHREANSALLLYLEYVLGHVIVRSEGTTTAESEKLSLRPLVEQCFQEHGQTLINNLVAGIAGKLPRSHISSRREGSLSGTLFTAGVFYQSLPHTPLDGANFRAMLDQSLRTSDCAHVGGDLAQWFLAETVGMVVRGRASSPDGLSRPPPAFEDLMHDFSYKARLRLRRVDLGADAEG